MRSLSSDMYKISFRGENKSRLFEEVFVLLA